MSNTEIFGSPMILTGRNVVSPFGGATNSSFRNHRLSSLSQRLGRLLRGLLVRSDEQRRVRKTTIALARLDDHMLRDIGLNRAAIISAAHEAEQKRQQSIRPLRR